MRHGTCSTSGTVLVLTPEVELLVLKENFNSRNADQQSLLYKIVKTTHKMEH